MIATTWLTSGQACDGPGHATLLRDGVVTSRGTGIPPLIVSNSQDRLDRLNWPACDPAIAQPGHTR
eukprot:13392101-Alexandrium_andersonii.AAC.1